MITIFEQTSFDRSIIKWEEHVLDLSPVEKIGDIQIKREDYFAPLGYNGINGSKLRVAIWLVSEAIRTGAKGVINGAVKGSPQHPMIAAICKHFGIPCRHVIGVKNVNDFDNLKMAKRLGSEFIFSKIAYAHNLELTAFKQKREDEFVLETNITLDERKNSAERIEAFHKVGSEQVKNIGDDIETIILPAGSCNSALGVLYGIARFRPKGLKRIILMGIGSWGSKDPGYLFRRMKILESVSGFDICNLFRANFIHDKDKEPKQWEHIKDSAPYELLHYNINGTGYAEYDDLMNFNYHGVSFHPRYEGKIWNYMKDNPKIFDQYMNDKTLFWIVGSLIDSKVIYKYV